MTRRNDRIGNPARSDGRFTDATRAILTLAFVLSGAAGLIYESIWTRYLGLFVGHSAYAQVIVLVIFMGGMAIIRVSGPCGRDPLRPPSMRQTIEWLEASERRDFARASALSDTLLP